MASKPVVRSGKISLAWSEATEARARRLANAKRQTIAVVVEQALELAEIRYEAEQQALAAHYAGQAKRRAS